MILSLNKNSNETVANTFINELLILYSELICILKSTCFFIINNEHPKSIMSCS